MQGHCLCGGVTLEAADANRIGLCHCRMCRRWSGGPFFALHCDGPVTARGTTLAVYPSSAWAERAFCQRCGTHLYYRLVPDGAYFVSAGLFDGGDFELASQIFIDEKPDFYALANHTDMLTGAQVMARYGDADDG